MSARRSAKPGEINAVSQKLLIYAVLALGSLLMLLPFFWMVSTAFKKSGAVFIQPIQWIPKEPTLDNFKKLFIDFQFQNYIGNTVWLTAVNMAGYMVSCALVAYGFATQRYKHKNALFLLVLATMMLPKEVIFYPRFILFKYLGLYGTMAPLWLPAFFGDAFQIFLMRQFFMGIPTELGEAAKIDGCSRLRIFGKIYLPLSKPVMATSAIYIFMFHWNDFFGPLIYITKESNRTAALALMYLKSSFYVQSLMPTQMCGAIVTAMPCLLLYYFCQRYFVAGMTVSTGVEK
ncbi:MAG: carbohydrate ABC transporter permease [Provencibacterium sp.]|jgi:multiple sugar transport system permease protein|nr:carbohydrate ABC transporter permease [Provencibacterium sp.]